MTKIATLWIAAALLLAGCAPAMSTASASSREDAAVSALQTSLTDAVTVAKEYGRQHLGHYLELNRKALRDGGLAVPAGVELEVHIDHFEVCITGTASDLPAGHEWRTATVTSADDDPAPGATCGDDALRTVSVR
jgi:hypothetical protein